ncbi:winged helix-turn-helix domain-containing protein [Kribbella sancticallisti]|uniref:Winged helix-turn-helix domain-containing protein n=1 Tax=Kribbella sancticallisti TaxID=460087 RepID=A0ABP4NIB0_9ACTN
MLRIYFDPEDLAQTTLLAEPAPLWEALLSLHMLQVGDGPVPFGAWRTRQRRWLNREIVGPLAVLAPPAGYSPDFLTPSVGPASFDEAVEVMLSTPGRRVRTDLARLAPRSGAGWVRQLAQPRAEAMHQLGQSLRIYHRSALEPYWPSIRAAVHADYVERRDQLAAGGVGALLEGVHPRARWRDGVLEIAAFQDEELWLNGRGLQLQPSYFCWQQPIKLLDPDLPPVLVFPIRGATGLLRATQGPADSVASLVALLGRTRAMVLVQTVTEVTTTKIAGACDISLATASHQTRVLREAGLILSRRRGKSVVHTISALGYAVLEGHPWSGNAGGIGSGLSCPGPGRSLD